MTQKQQGLMALTQALVFLLPIQLPPVHVVVSTKGLQPRRVDEVGLGHLVFKRPGRVGVKPFHLRVPKGLVQGKDGILPLRLGQVGVLDQRQLPEVILHVAILLVGACEH